MNSLALENEPSPSFALSPEQRALLAMIGGEAQLSTANRLLLIDLDGPLAGERLRAAVQRTLARHGALRSALLTVTGFRSLRQRVLVEAPPLRWQVLDLRTATHEAEHSWLAALRSAPLAVERGEVLRGALIVRAEERRTLALIVNRLALDSGDLARLSAEIAAAYTSTSDEEGAPSFEYSQFVEWRQALEEGEEATAGAEYWNRYLNGLGSPIAPRLPARRRQSSGEEGTVSVCRALDSSLAQRVSECARELGVTDAGLLQAVWWLLLSRLLRYPGFLAGWQQDCRDDYPVMQGTLGVFCKVLPLGIDVRPDQTFAAWVASLEQRMAAHREAQEYWNVESPAISGQHSVGFFARAVLPRSSSALSYRLRQAPSVLPCFELALEAAIGEVDGELTVHAERAWYSEPAATRLMDQFLTLLRAALECPRALTSELPLLTDAEREQFVVSATKHVDFGQESVAARIARWAETTPDAIAIESGAHRLSYRELELQVSRTAHWLASEGAASGTLVALNLPRSPALLVALLATWRVGAAYLPLEPEWPSARRAALLRASGAVLCVNGDKALDSDVAVRQVSISDWDQERGSGGPLSRAGSLGDAAYVLYTSGSTGTPKGVVIEHRQLLNYVAAATRAMNLESVKRWALTSSVVADLGNTALFGALFNGACLVIASQEQLKDGHSFASFLTEHAIDGLKMVPSHLDALLECDSPALPSTLVLGGEAAPQALIERVLGIAPTCAIYNHYGPTETTIGVMVHRVDSERPLPEVLPLTRTLDNTRVLVLDERLQLVPPGGLGDVYVGGAQLCRGYLNDATRAAFIDDPYLPGARLYRTGDVAQVLLEGGIQLVGRADQQLKIRGFRVDPAEVEGALLARPGVRQGAVIAIDSAGQPELVAIAVLDEGLLAERSATELHGWLAQLLPSHMLPTRYVFLAELPRLGNGKLDRVALASALRSAPSEREVDPPRDALEWVLVACMSRLLNAPVIGIHDDFFARGGHSLLAIKLVARIRKILHMNVPPALVFDHRSPAALAEALRCSSTNRAQLEDLAETERTALARSTPNSGDLPQDPSKLR